MAINYRFYFLHRSATSDILNIKENGSLLLGPASLPRTDFGEFLKFAKDETFSATRDGGVPNNASVIRIQVNGYNQEAKTWLDSYEIFYQRKFEAEGGEDVLLFTTADISGKVQYSVSNLSSEVRAFDVTMHYSVKQITQLEFNPKCTFQLQQQGGIVREIAVVGRNGYKTPRQQ